MKCLAGQRLVVHHNVVRLEVRRDLRTAAVADAHQNLVGLE
jgi:hypothetical protein